MNKLESTSNGGMPLRLDDLRWVTAGIQDVLKGITTPFV